MASESAATRANCDANNQKILDNLCQLEMDGMRQNYENRIGTMQNTIDGLRASLNAANGAASQNAQTAQILADNSRQTAVLEDYLNPVARPAYIVQNPNCCQPNYGCGCCNY
jgi:methyl-accepting chemotaxis protein